MGKCPKYIVSYMHAFLDGEITNEEKKIMDDHLKQCEDCRHTFEELEETVTLFQSVDGLGAPAGFVNGVTTKLPKKVVKKDPVRWFRQHPFMVAASLFLLLMSASLFSNFENDQQFSFTKQPNVIVEGETVVVPAGETVVGDLVVKNGNLRVEGQVDGNVTVIRGTKYMASTAVVTGSSEEIDEMFDWLWYKMKSMAKDIVPGSKVEKPENE